MKQIKQWTVAIAVSCLLMNIVVAFYSYDPGWIKRSGGATPGIYEAGRTIIKTDEGFSVTPVDDNGYLNTGTELAENYILILGNSQSNGVNVMPDEKYAELLNRRLKTDRSSDQMQVYNVSNGGADFCDIVKGFSAALEEFPGPRTVVIQILTTDLPTDKLKDSIVQREFLKETTSAYLEKNLSMEQKVRNILKDYFPLAIYMADMKLSQIRIDFSEAFWCSGRQKAEEFLPEGSEEAGYEESLNNVLTFLRNGYDGNIIILNLPGINFEMGGALRVVYQKNEELFKEMCAQNDIIYYNMGEDYKREYQQNCVLPYGFANTRPGAGHLNREGHRMVADALYELIKNR